MQQEEFVRFRARLIEWFGTQPDLEVEEDDPHRDPQLIFVQKDGETLCVEFYPSMF